MEDDMKCPACGFTGFTENGYGIEVCMRCGGIMEEINKEEINRYLTEKMGLCWHKYRPIGFGKYGCWDCGYENKDKKQRDTFSPEGFFILWNFSIEQDWWEHFVDIPVSAKRPSYIDTRLINPEVFPIEVYNYLRGREK